LTFFFHDPPPTAIYTLSLHDALPICFLGLELADVDGAVTVKAVLADSPAAKAGLKVGDRITEYRGKAVAATADLLKHAAAVAKRSEEHTSELQSQSNLVCRLLLEKKK